MTYSLAYEQAPKGTKRAFAKVKTASREQTKALQDDARKPNKIIKRVRISLGHVVHPSRSGELHHIPTWNLATSTYVYMKIDCHYVELYYTPLVQDCVTRSPRSM